jgi:acetyl-CoA acetyltransferase
MRDVSVVGANMIRFGKYPDKTVAQLGQEVVMGLMKNMNLDREKIDAVYTGNVMGGSLVSQRIFKELGMTGIPMYNVENACASGATAFHQAYQSVAAGVYDVALVVGVEQLSRLGGGTLPLNNEDIEVNHGIVMPGVYAMRAQRYMKDYGATAEDLALVSVKNRHNGSLNPYAHFQEGVTLENVLNSRMVAEPFNLLQCCPTSDGAAAILICSTNRKKEFTSDSVKIKGSVVTSGYFKGGYRDMTWPEITYRATNEAYKSAGITAQDIDLAEVHDAFSIAEILYYETMGFCEKGEGYKFIRDGKAALEGDVAVNPSGGLMSRGHPVGASGVAQLVEVFWQLTGQAGKRQVKNAKLGLTHVTGGGISGVDNGACGVHILMAD